jgi:hypothetical protein
MGLNKHLRKQKYMYHTEAFQKKAQIKLSFFLILFFFSPIQSINPYLNNICCVYVNNTEFPNLHAQFFFIFSLRVSA